MQTSDETEGKAILVVSRTKMEYIVASAFEPNINKVHLLKNNCVIISIFGNSYFGLDCGGPNTLFTNDMKEELLKVSEVKDILNLNFGDYTSDDKDTENETLFSEKQAKDIVEFVDKYKDEVDLFVVHCDAGMSRSGAVGTFLQRYLDVNEKSFKQLNPQITPNHMVLNMLMEVSGLKKKREMEQYKLFIEQRGGLYADKMGWE